MCAPSSANALSTWSSASPTQHHREGLLTPRSTVRLSLFGSFLLWLRSFGRSTSRDGGTRDATGCAFSSPAHYSTLGSMQGESIDLLRRRRDAGAGFGVSRSLEPKPTRWEHLRGRLVKHHQRIPRSQMAAAGAPWMLSGVGEAFSTVFVSEVGDKTFFLSMMLAVRRGRVISLVSSLTALYVMVFVSVAIGGALKHLPQKLGSTMPVNVGAALLMIAFGVQSLMEREEECDEKNEAECDIDKMLKKRERNGFVDWIRFSTMVFLAEWGDRSMLATVALSAARSPAGVMLGGCLGHTLAASLAVVGGGLLGKYVNDKAMKTIGGALFLVFGVTTLLGVY